MVISSGDKLGPYEILTPLGAGGMGEVWKARDSRLDRIVAIKRSKSQFSERSEREAHAIAALNHPNICSLYDVGPDYLVMEYVEGKPPDGPLPLDQALEIARQILDALDAAHRKGIIHRDLKPGNILVTKSGVKLLDFGLAKIEHAKPDGAAQMETSPLTGEGMILGTLQYMSPEQIEGREADARSDIFAFGLVLYEMISGKPPFYGTTKTSLIASILKEQPRPLNDLQPLAPQALDRVIQTCLEKDPDKRWQSAREVKHALDWIAQSAPVPAVTTAAPAGKRWLWPAVAALLVAALGGAVWALWPKPTPLVKATRFQIPVPDKGDFGQYLSLSPDGRKLVFNTTGMEGGLWVRNLDTLDARLLPGTQDAIVPFWSSDSKYVAFGIGNQLKKIDVTGGPPQTLCEAAQPIGSGAWNRDGVIIFGGRGSGALQRVSEAGGVPAPVTTLGAGTGGFHTMPSFLPDVRHFIYFRGGRPETTGLYIGSLDSKPDQQSQKRLLATIFGGIYVLSQDGGRVFFLRDGTLMTQPLDASKLMLTGDPIPVAEHIGTGPSHGFFSVSPSGALAYRTGASAGGMQLTWFDREGKNTGIFAESRTDRAIALSPDSARAIVRDAPSNTAGDLWLLDFARSVRSRFTFRRGPGSAGVWSSDGKRIAFSGGDGLDTLFEKDSSGAGQERELLKKPGEPKAPTSWSRDGRFLLYFTSANPKTLQDIWLLPLEGERQPVPILVTDFRERDARFSPDSRWIAYTSEESGRAEIYVMPFTPPGSGASLAGGKWQVSKDGGTQAKWRADGKELFFRAFNGAPMAVEVNTSGTFQAGVPKQLFAVPQQSIGDWDITPDGKRILAAMPPQQTSQTPITVVLNWASDLRR